MPVQVWFPSDSHTVMPGERRALSATVENPGPSTEAYTVVPWGLNASWVSVEETSITLFGGTARTVDVVIHPPRVWTTTAGRYEVEIRVVPHRDPLAAMSAVAVIDVGGFEDVSVVVIPQEQRVHRRARYEIDVTNRSNHLLNCRVRFAAQSGDIKGRLDPSLLTLSAGASGVARLTVLAADPWFRRAERSSRFDVEVEVPGDHEPVNPITASATVQLVPTMSPDRLRDRPSTSVVVRIVAAMLVIAGAWWLLVEPWIQHRIERAAEQRVSSRSASADSTPFAIALSSLVAVDRTGLERYRGSSGSGAWVDELIIQNPHRDAGTAVLTVGDAVVHEWDLSALTGTVELVTLSPPVEVGPHDVAALSVDCAQPGGTDQRCETTLLLIARPRSP